MKTRTLLPINVALGAMLLFSTCQHEAYAQTLPMLTAAQAAQAGQINYVRVPNGISAGVDGYVPEQGTSNGSLNVNGGTGGGSGGTAFNGQLQCFVTGNSGTTTNCLDDGGGLVVNKSTITAPGTSAANAQGIQGVTGGLPVSVTGTVAVTGAYQTTQPVSGNVGTTPNPTYSTPKPATVAIGTTVTNVGTAGNYHWITIEVMGSVAVCADFGTETLTAPTGTGNSGVCAAGQYLQPSQTFTKTSTDGVMPSSQYRAIAAFTGASIFIEVQ